MPMVEVQEMSRLLLAYQSLEQQYEAVRTTADMLAFNQLLSSWQTLKHASDAYERQIATDYNVFGIYESLYYDETRLHSPFLAHLLDPNGSHCQGDLFFRAFLREVGIEGERYENLDPYFFNVKTEHHTGDGRIDILITYRDAQRSFAIAIENKIWAGDQVRQLERYHDYLKSKHPDRFILIYLTVDGVLPSQGKTGSITTERWNEVIQYVQLASHRGHVARMLATTVPQIQAPNVRFIVQQYADAIGWI